MDTANPKRGDEFVHARWLEEDGVTPLRCRVTRVARGVVYYRPADNGAPEYISREKFQTVVQSTAHPRLRTSA